MKTNSELERDVEAELRWAPDVDETDIAVKVNNGVVALSGFARSYFDKWQAENVVKRVAGVAGVANDIQVRLGDGYAVEDPDIARAAVSAIKGELPFIADNVKVIVSQGHVTLEGSLEWNFQREMAERAVRPLKGVAAVNNQISITPRVKPAEIKRKIEDAFRRSAEVDAKGISVVADGGEVKLVGNVRSWSERTQAQQTAWAAPGVTSVKNELMINA